MTTTVDSQSQKEVIYRDFEELAKIVDNPELTSRMKSYIDKKWLVVESFVKRNERVNRSSGKIYRGIGKESIATFNKHSLGLITSFGVLNSKIYDLFFDESVGFSELSPREVNSIIEHGFSFSRIDEVDSQSLKMMNCPPLMRYNLNIFKFDEYKNDGDFFNDLRSFCQDLDFNSKYIDQEIKYFDCCVYGVKAYLFSKFGKEWRDGLPIVSEIISDIDALLNSGIQGPSIHMTNRNSTVPGVHFGVHPDNSNVSEVLNFNTRYGRMFVADAIDLSMGFDEALEQQNSAAIEIQNLYSGCRYFVKGIMNFCIAKHGDVQSEVWDFIKSMDGQMVYFQSILSKNQKDFLNGNLCREVLL